MEHKKILNSLNEPHNSKFTTRKWNIVNDHTNANCDVENEIIDNTELLKSNLCNYNDAYILVRGDVTVIEVPANQVSFKNCAQFTKRITKIDGTTIDDAEDVYLVRPMCNIIEYSSNCFETAGSLWLYSTEKTTNFNVDIGNNNSKYFEYKGKLLGNTVAQPNQNQTNRVLQKCNNCCAIKIFKQHLEITRNVIN